MKLLIITPSFPPILNPEALVTAKLTRALVEAGVEVTVVTQDASLIAGALDPSECWREGLGTVHRLLPSWWGQKSASGWSKVRRQDQTASWFSEAAASFCRRLVRERSFDWVMSRAPHGDAMYVAEYLQRKHGLKWAASLSDPYPYFLLPPPYRAGRAETVWERRQAGWTRRVLARADRVLFPSARLGRWMERALDLELGPRKLVVPHIGWSAARATSPDGRFEILHTGGVHAARSNPDFFRALAQARSACPGLEDTTRVVMLGGADPLFSEHLRELGLERVILVEATVPFEQALERMARAGALLLIEARLGEGIFLPSKFCDYAVSGVPLLMFSPEEGEICDLVGGSRHPGFLGQRPEYYTPGLGEFFRRLAEGEDLHDYTYPNSEEFHPSRVAAGLLAGLS